MQRKQIEMFAAQSRVAALALVVSASLLAVAGVHAQKRSAPAPRASAPRPAAHAATPATHTAPGAARGTAGTTSRGAATGGARPGVTRTASGAEVTRGANGRPSSVRTANGSTAHFDNAGHVREVHAGNTTVVHGPGGSRRVISEGPNHTRYVSYGHGRGYVQRPYMYHGHAFEGRTYYRGGIARHEFYRPYYYHGVYLHGYYPSVFYAPAFYGWAYAPWAAPVYYHWGWVASPWYGYYGPYFAPYPAYPTAALWLTDYIVSSNLQAAYAAGVAAGAAGAETGMARRPGATGSPHLLLASYLLGAFPLFTPPGGTVGMTPEVKQAIANEVQLSLAAEKAQAAQGGDSDAAAHGLDQLLADGKPHVFVASDAISVPDSGGQDCSLSGGDVLQLNTAPAASADSGQLQVLASKQSDCATGSTVTVTLENLQDMHNNLMASVDAGLGDLQKNAGQNGLPAAPQGSAATTTAPYAAAAPPDDPNAQQELAKVDADGTQAEQGVMNEVGQASPGDAQPVAEQAAAPASSPAGPVSIALGQTPTQVTAMKGQPRQIVNLGAKQIYVYGDMKIYFVGGKVSDVQ